MVAFFLFLDPSICINSYYSIRETFFLIVSQELTEAGGSPEKPYGTRVNEKLSFDLHSPLTSFVGTIGQVVATLVRLISMPLFLP